MNYLDFNFFQITLQFIVITWAIFFIFLGVPLLFVHSLCPLHILPIYRHLLLVLLQGSGVDEGKC